MSDAAHVESIGIRRAPAERFTKIDNRLVVLLLQSCQDASLAVGVAVLRVKTDSLGKVAHGLVVVSQSPMRCAAHSIGAGIGWSKPDRFIEIGAGQRLVALRQGFLPLFKACVLGKHGGRGHQGEGQEGDEPAHGRPPSWITPRVMAKAARFVKHNVVAWVSACRVCSSP